MEDLGDFLTLRSIPKETIEMMKNERIDTNTILLMTDEELKTYLPSYGDRLAVLGYCRRKENGNTNSRKSKLFERLNSKLGKRKPCNEEANREIHEEQSERTTKKNGLKLKRKIEIGWMMYDDEKQAFKQVRAKRGGGTRKVEISKDAKKSDLLQIGADLFFTEGRNSEGPLEDFDLDLRDYQELTVDEKTTVGQLYNDTKLPLIRFYLTTSKKIPNKFHKDNAALSPPFAGTEISQQQSSTHLVSTTSQSAATFETVSSDVIFVESTSHDNFTFSHQSAELGQDDLESSNIVFIGDFSASEPKILDDTLPMSTQTMVSTETVKKILVVHRGQILPELMAHFCEEGLEDKEIQIQLVLPDGKLEMGYDVGGVVRDCLSEFWKEFYEQCTTGNTFKVPFLRHDFGQQEWESIGRIIAFGWMREKYLPVKLAPVILEQAALGEVKSDVVENFLKCMPESERLVFESWRSDFSRVDQEELLDILDNHSCRRVPTASNANEILQELAHKTLIQEPAYVTEQWVKILGNISYMFPDLLSVYENLQPTVRKVLKSLTFPEEINSHQKDIQNYLTSYVRNADLRHLSLFLRFCTGSDLFLNKNIVIDFNKIQGFQRRPVADTCGCMLELSVCYDSYPDFSSEMNKVLESNIWVMDII